MLEAEHIRSDVRVPRYAMFVRYLQFTDAQYTLLVITGNNNNNNNKTQPEYYILFISKMALLKTTTCFGLIILGHLQVVYILFSRRTVQCI
jgi:hypothetical protein